MRAQLDERAGSTSKRTRILVADDHRLVAETVKSALEPEYEVVGVVTDGVALVKAALALKPDLVIVDIGMPQLNGLDAAEQIKRKLPSTKLVFLTMNAAADVAAEAFRRGAAAYVLKQSAAEELLVAIRKALVGEPYITPLITRDVAYFLAQQSVNPDKHLLTARQREILQLLAEGMSMREVATVLNLSQGTIAFHKYKMMKALKLRTNAELLEYAIRSGITGSL
jgi:DNA-binding NarL/FixJ family response regulator